MNTYQSSAHCPSSTKHRLLRIGYLVSMYPAVSHTFILREVLALRERSIQIEVASINTPSNYGSLTSEEQREAAKTFFVKQVGATGALRAIAQNVVRHPLRFARGLALAWTLSGLNFLRLPRYTFYWIEALILMKWMADRALDHLHVHFATPASTVALILAHMAPVTFSITVHGPDEFYDVSEYNLVEKACGLALRGLHQLLRPQSLMKLADRRDWSKIDLARLGVDCIHFSPGTRREMPEPFEILCVGRLTSTKGQRILIEAVRSIDRRRSASSTASGRRRTRQEIFRELCCREETL